MQCQCRRCGVRGGLLSVLQGTLSSATHKYLFPCLADFANANDRPKSEKKESCPGLAAAPPKTAPVSTGGSCCGSCGCRCCCRGRCCCCCCWCCFDIILLLSPTFICLVWLSEESPSLAKKYANGLCGTSESNLRVSVSVCVWFCVCISHSTQARSVIRPSVSAPDNARNSRRVQATWMT